MNGSDDLTAWIDKHGDTWVRVDEVAGRLSGAAWSPNLDDYATGRIDADRVHCLMCDVPCTGEQPEFVTPAYMAALDRSHGRKR